MTEYWEWRCCMCPQQREDSNECPAGTPCRFVQAYIDDSGRKYRVIDGNNDGEYRAQCRDDMHAGDAGWFYVARLPWRGSFDEAQGDLNKLAEREGWKVWKD